LYRGISLEPEQGSPFERIAIVPDRRPLESEAMTGLPADAGAISGPTCSAPGSGVGLQRLSRALFWKSLN
jgi:hypothetical protein